MKIILVCNNFGAKYDGIGAYAEKIYNIHTNDKPSASESCTTIYEFFKALDDRNGELKNMKPHFKK